MSYLVPQKKH